MPCGSLVKIGTTAAQKKLFFNLRKVKGQLKAYEEGDLSQEHVTEIATRLNVSEQEVISMNRRLAAQDNSLNTPLREDGDSEWIDWLVDTETDAETRLADKEEMDNRRQMLVKSMSALNDRERHILTERRLKDEPTTLEDLSKVYDISRERVRQIEVRAFEKLQKAMKNLTIEQRVNA
jgi:RNA polymerase sigma-32 factor